MAPSSTVQPPPPRICASSSTFATVVMGKKPFVVHEDLLTYHSPFFRAVFKGGFEEAANKKVQLDEVDKDTIELVVGDNGTGKEQIIHLIRLHVFSDKYDVPALKSRSLELLLHVMRDDATTDMPLSTDISYAFANTPNDSPPCRLLVDWKDCGNIGDELPLAFFRWPSTDSAGSLSQSASL
ncbi:hypothetical protein E8E11_005398 [Didymella keratinophila]|nr:hypothetical protein E8E11_005398 [Didymella keratinophila]